MAGGLSLADEPLLEAALEDRSAWVRKMAADVLAALPGSALAQRMAERAGRCLRLDRGIRGTRLLVSPPTECDAAMRRDGITPSPGAGRSQQADRARLLLDVVARTPLRTWTDGLGMTSAEIVGIRSSDWAPVLFTGWSRAAMAQRDQEWIAALINRAIAGGLPGHPSGADTLRQLVRRVDPALVTPADGTVITPKYVGSRRLIEVAVATPATDRALLLLGVPGTAKTWLSEHLGGWRSSAARSACQMRRTARRRSGGW